jgi:hypothetical protein
MIPVRASWFWANDMCLGTTMAHMIPNRRRCLIHARDNLVRWLDAMNQTNPLTREHRRHLREIDGRIVKSRAWASRCPQGANIGPSSCR